MNTLRIKPFRSLFAACLALVATVSAFAQAAAPAAATPPPPPAPTLDNTSKDGDIAAQQMAQALNRGRTATMVTGGQGLKDLGTTSKTLLGS